MTSACYVYAIARREMAPPTANTGVPTQLTMVPWRDLAAVIGPTMFESTSLTVDAMLQHEAVVEAVRKCGPAIPVRFGTVFRDATSVAAALAKGYEPLAADVERLGDKVELSLTALWPPPATPSSRITTSQEGRAVADASAGARYLYARAAELQREDALKERASAVAETLERALGALAIERRVSILPRPGVAVRSAYLLAPSGVAAFHAAFDAMRRDEGDVRFLLTGPWPPYSFVRRAQTDTTPVDN